MKCMTINSIYFVYSQKVDNENDISAYRNVLFPHHIKAVNTRMCSWNVVNKQDEKFLEMCDASLLLYSRVKHIFDILPFLFAYYQMALQPLVYVNNGSTNENRYSDSIHMKQQNWQFSVPVSKMVSIANLAIFLSFPRKIAQSAPLMSAHFLKMFLQGSATLLGINQKRQHNRRSCHTAISKVQQK